MTMATSVKLSVVVPSRFAHLTPTDEANVERIRADLENGTKLLLNVPHVFKNEAGKYELLAGHDRTEAARRAGWADLPVRDFSGTVNTDDAILAHFCRENLLRKDISKAAIAGEWLRKHPEWTDVRIAAESGCDNGYVGEVRAKLVAEGVIGATQLRTTADGKERKYTPRAERKPRTTPAKPKSNADEWARQIAESAAARAAQQSPPQGEQSSGAEKEAPEAAASLASTDDGRPLALQAEVRPDGSEVGAPTGAHSPLQNLGTSEQVPTSTAPAEHDAAGDPSDGDSRSASDSPVDEQTSGALNDSGIQSDTPVTAAVVSGGAPSFVVTMLASLPEHPSPPTTDDLAPLTKADVDRLLSWGRWAQTVAARWALLQQEREKAAAA